VLTLWEYAENPDKSRLNSTNTYEKENFFNQPYASGRSHHSNSTKSAQFFKGTGTVGRQKV